MPTGFSRSGWCSRSARSTAKSMGVLDKTHQLTFDALYRDNLRPQSLEEIADLYATCGVDKEDVPLHRAVVRRPRTDHPAVALAHQIDADPDHQLGEITASRQHRSRRRAF